MPPHESPIDGPAVVRQLLDAIQVLALRNPATIVSLTKFAQALSKDEW